MVLTLLFLVFLISNTYSQNDRWIKKGISIVNDNLLLFEYDQETIKYSNNTFEFWLKTKWSKREYNKEFDSYEDYSLYYAVINCSDKTIEYKSITIYFTDGTTYSYKKDELGEVSMIKPDTVMEDYYLSLCK